MKNVIEILKEYKEKGGAEINGEWYNKLGFRTQVEEFPPISQSLTHKSNRWDDNNMLEDKINGVCAVSLPYAIKMLENPSFYGFYPGNNCAILAAETEEYGEDEGEIIFDNPIVVWENKE